jgi:hypothetical protein
VKDGGNWYSYVRNNPVVFIDPWGLYTDYLMVNGSLAFLSDRKFSQIGYVETNDLVEILNAYSVANSDAEVRARPENYYSGEVNNRKFFINQDTAYDFESPRGMFNYKEGSASVTSYFSAVYCNGSAYVKLDSFATGAGISDKVVWSTEEDLKTKTSMYIKGLKLAYNNENGLAQLIENDTIDPNRNPDLGYYTYKTKDAELLPWGKPEVIELMLSIAKEWNMKHPDRPLMFGDLSNESGGNQGYHSGHTEGIHLDIRPVRGDTELSGTTFNSSTYDQALTDELIRLFIDTGAVTNIYFNDSTIVKTFDIVNKYSGHDDHLHIDF